MTDLELHHYQPWNEPFVFDRERVYDQRDGSFIFKPRGLWVSVPGQDPDWPNWCHNEEYGDPFTWDAHRIVLAEDANLLHLAGAKALDEFTEQFSDERLNRDLPGHPYHHGGINWGLVARAFQGIVITPYCWSRRHQLSWYYGWDCASGCIWDLSAIAAVEPIPGWKDSWVPNHPKEEAS